MKLLFLTPQLPYPPQQGAALRNWGFLHELARRHEVHLLSFGAPPSPTLPALASLTVVPLPQRSRLARLRDLVATTEPDMARRLAAPLFERALGALLAAQHFDAVQVEAVELLRYALPFLGQPGPRWIYDAHNAETELQRSALRSDARRPRRWHAALYSAVQVAKLRRYEAAHLPRFDLVVAVSEADARQIEADAGVAPLVIPNGIDSAAAAPGSAAAAPALRQRPGPALVFTGKMDFRPNVDGVLWFADEILPRLGSGPLAPTLWVVGQAPHPALERLRGHPQIVLTGWVEAVEPFLAGADVVVVPLRMGSGTRLKVLQALSMARPVVGTTLGCTGLALRDGEQLRLADEPASFAAAIRALLAEPTHAAALGERGRIHVQERFDWQVLVPRLEERLRALTPPGPA